MKLWRTESPPTVDLAPRLEAVERRVKVIEAEWDEMFDKYRRLYARLSKRLADSEKADRQQESVPVPPFSDDHTYAAYQRRALAQRDNGGR